MINSRQRRKIEAEKHNAAYEESKKPKPLKPRSKCDERVLATVMSMALCHGVNIEYRDRHQPD